MTGGVNDRDLTDETSRQYRVVDLLLSMHARLREKYDRRALLLNTVQIGVSLFLTCFAFVNDELLLRLGGQPEMTRLVAGVSGVVILLLAITEFRVDWKSAGSQHGQAAKDLAALKARYRRARVPGGWDAARCVALTREFEGTMARIVPIPEGRFNRLKAAHEFKRALSRRLGENPAVPWWLAWLRLRWEGMEMELKKERKRGQMEDRRVR